MTSPDRVRESYDRFGLEVIEIAGWRTRGSYSVRPNALLLHHTATSVYAPGPWPSGRLLIEGRGGPSPVPGPLCNDSLGRDLIVRLVAFFSSNNAGKGSWRGYSSNYNTWGTEVEHCGFPSIEPVSSEMYEAMVRLKAANCWAWDVPSSHVCQHFEWTVRKIDFCEGLFHPDTFRDDVRKMLTGAPPPSPTPPPPPPKPVPPPEDDEDMPKPFVATPTDEPGAVYVYNTELWTKNKIDGATAKELFMAQQVGNLFDADKNRISAALNRQYVTVKP